MKAASIAELKGALKEKTGTELAGLCLRLARYKKENKELLTYLLFEADDIETYIRHVKKEIEKGFDAITTTNVYFIKKSLRKVLRNTGKYIRYTGSRTVEAELLLHFCTALKNADIPVHKSTALTKLYEGQLKKIDVAISTLHEDLQHDYRVQLDALS
jgi:hypothetical protein